eukprot:2610607-Rhodomonas_salina.1
MPRTKSCATLRILRTRALDLQTAAPRPLQTRRARSGDSGARLSPGRGTRLAMSERHCAPHARQRAEVTRYHVRHVDDRHALLHRSAEAQHA